MAATVLDLMEDHRREIGRRAVRFREERGLSQEDVARAADLSTKTVSRYENGRHEGRSDTTRRIAKALKVSVEDLLGRQPSPLALGSEVTQLDRVESKLDALLIALNVEWSLDLLDPEGDLERALGGDDEADAGSPPVRDEDAGDPETGDGA